MEIILLIGFIFWYIVSEAIETKGKDAAFIGIVKNYQWWGRMADTWKNKYKLDEDGDLIEHKSWYNKIAGIKYKERFLFSSNILVWLTDRHHARNLYYVLSFSYFATVFLAKVFLLPFALLFLITLVAVGATSHILLFILK